MVSKIQVFQIYRSVYKIVSFILYKRKKKWDFSFFIILLELYTLFVLFCIEILGIVYLCFIFEISLKYILDIIFIFQIIKFIK